MNGVEEITATKAEAKAKYREYRSALAKQPLPWVRELKDAYNQLRRGHGIIDVFKAFKMAGVNEDGEPRLAIFPAHLPKCFFQKETGGSGQFVHGFQDWKHKPIIVMPQETFPEWKRSDPNNRWTILRNQISCPVPIVPPHLMPRTDLSNFHILWEVEKWSPEPPRDPFLLRRVSQNLFAVVAKWDLTELERAVIAGRIR